MFYLKPGVDFEEIKVARPAVVDEFDRTGGTVGDPFTEAAGGGVQRGPGRFRQARRGRLLNHLLVAALGGTVAFSENRDVTPPVPEQLHFDMPGTFDVLLDEQPGVLEVIAAQPADPFETGGQFRVGTAHAHADAASARRTFEHHRITDSAGGFERSFGSRQQAASRNQRHLEPLRQFPRPVLQPEVDQLFRRGADENDSGRFALPGEIGVFTQETVAGMNRFGPGFPRGGENRRNVEVAFGGRSRTEPDRLVGGQHVRGGFIDIGVDRDRTDLHLPERPDDPAGDFAAVCDQYFLEHKTLILSRRPR